MTRRDMLVKMFGAAAAAAVAPLIDLTDATPAFWNQASLRELMPWKIVFPDGTAWAFEARVVAETLLDDGTVSLSVVPTSNVRMSHGEPLPEGERLGGELHAEGRPVAELHNITLPSVTVKDNDYIYGLRKADMLTFTVKFDE